MQRLFLVVLLCLAACTQQGWNDRLASPQEQALALRAANQLRAGEVDQLAKEAAPELRQQLPSYMKQVAPMLMPVQGNFRSQTVGSFHLSGGPTTKTFVVQGGSGDHWAVVRVVFQAAGDEVRLVGLNVTPFKADPSEMDSFEIGKQRLIGYF